MFIECQDEVRVQHAGREHLFEERRLFGYVYGVPDELGKAAIATGKCREVKDYKGPAEVPSSSSLPVAETPATAAPAAEPAATPTASRIPGRPKRTP